MINLTWAVITTNKGGDQFVKTFEMSSQALTEGQKEWDSLTDFEKETHNIEVVKINWDSEKNTYPENEDGTIDGDIYQRLTDREYYDMDNLITWNDINLRYNEAIICDGGIQYRAFADGSDGNEYYIEWDVKKSVLELEENNREIEKLEDKIEGLISSGAPDDDINGAKSELEAFKEANNWGYVDDSDACDWDIFEVREA